MAMATAPSSCAASFPARPADARPRAAGGVVRAAGGAGEGGSKWWAPLLGWSGKADYLEAPARVAAQDGAAAARRRRPFVGGRADGGEGAGAAGADGADGVVPRRHVPLRHRLPPRALRLGDEAGANRLAGAAIPPPPPRALYIVVA